MSEFSHSLHVFDASPEDVARAIQRSDASGVVFRDAGRYVCLVAACLDDRSAVERMARAIGGVVLDYAFADDHGCWLGLYDQGIQVAELVHNWEVGSSRFERAPWRDRQLLTDADCEAMANHLQRGDRTHQVDNPARYRIAEIFGLRQYAWLGPRDLDGTAEDLRAFHPDFGELIVVGDVFRDSEDARQRREFLKGLTST